MLINLTQDYISPFQVLAPKNSGDNGAHQDIYQSTQLSVAEQDKMFEEMKQTLAPFVGAGNNFLQQFQGALPGLTKTFNPTMSQLEQTPGFQFAQKYGQQGIQQGMAAKGLAGSGAAMQAGSGFAQGLASQTFQQQFSDYMAQNAQKYNMLMGATQMGANAAAAQGGAAMQLGTNIGNTYMNQGNQLANVDMQQAAQQNSLFGTIFGGLMGFL
jgi:hypothetical protein